MDPLGIFAPALISEKSLLVSLTKKQQLDMVQAFGQFQ